MTHSTPVDTYRILGRLNNFVVQVTYLQYNKAESAVSVVPNKLSTLI